MNRFLPVAAAALVLTGCADVTRPTLTRTADLGAARLGLIPRGGRPIDINPPDAVWSEATLINNAGQVAGNYRVASGFTRAFLWQDGRFTDLGDLGGGTSTVSDLNEAGQISGFTRRPQPSFEGRAFRWEDGRMIELPPYPGGNISGSTAINELGHVVGWATNPATAQPTLWIDVTPIRLGLLPGTFSGVAGDINDAGLITGGADFRGFVWEAGVMREIIVPSPGFTAGRKVNAHGQVVGTFSQFGEFRGFLWHHGVTIDLGHLGGFELRPFALNNLGHVVGYSRTFSQFGPRPLHAFLWRDGVLADLGGLDVERNSFALDVNDAGQVVGWASAIFDGRLASHAALWESGEVHDLGVLSGGCCSQALAINERGIAVGYSNTAGDATQHAVIFDPSVGGGPETPEEFIEAIGNAVATLLDRGDLNDGQARSLRAKLAAATAALERGTPTAAIGALRALIGELQALARARVLTPEDAEELATAAQDAIDLLTSP